MDADAVELPIFELPLVLLPGELLPLHIFEDRYKRMIARCLEDGEPFGVVFRDTDGGARRIGCEARVTEVTERFDDGRLNIVVTGERPFRVLDRFEASEFPAGEVEPVEATGDEAEEEDTEADGATSAREAFADLVERVGRREARPRRARGAGLVRHRRPSRAAAGHQAAAARAALGGRADDDSRQSARHPRRHRRALP